MALQAPPTSVADRPRAFVRISGPQAEDFLQRMVSNDVAALRPGASCDALLLTPKARVVALLRVLRRGEDDFLLLTEPELGTVVRDHLVRFRFAAQAEIEPEEHTSYLLLGAYAQPPAGATAIRSEDYGIPAFEVLDAEPAADEWLEWDELELLRILAGTPRHGREIDDRVLPAEAGLVERTVSLTKGCYPGQEPVARLHFRGHANRGLRRLRIEDTTPPEQDAELLFEGKAVGRVTSAVASEGSVLALAYVRTEVPDSAELRVGDAVARPLH
jgi:folate-binding protein YgfZ